MSDDIGTSPVPPEELDAVFDALEAGELGHALDLAQGLVSEYPEAGDAHLAHAAAAHEAGLASEALQSTLRAGELGSCDPVLQRYYHAAGLYRLWRFDEARELLRELLRENPQHSDGWYLLAQISEMLDDEVGARRGYEQAAELEPDTFPKPTRISASVMDRAISDARRDLPEAFALALDDMSVVVQPFMSAEMARPEDPSEDPFPPDLLGLFVGTNKLESSVFNVVDHPGVIFLFQKNLERSCPDLDTLLEEIRVTLWHELAHYLGFEEDDMEEMGLE